MPAKVDNFCHLQSGLSLCHQRSNSLKYHVYWKKQMLVLLFGSFMEPVKFELLDVRARNNHRVSNNEDTLHSSFVVNNCTETVVVAGSESCWLRLLTLFDRIHSARARLKSVSRPEDKTVKQCTKYSYNVRKLCQKTATSGAKKNYLHARHWCDISLGERQSHSCQFHCA